MSIEDRILSKIPLNQGWSDDRKSIVTTPKGQYLCRISKPERLFHVVKSFEHLNGLYLGHTPFSRPVECLFDEKGVRIYTTFVEGSDLSSILSMLSLKKQISLGVEAGIALRHIHQRVKVEVDANWAQKYNAKIDRKIETYRSCGIRFDGDEDLIRKIESLRGLLIDRPQTFQHGDYHIGNFVLTPDLHLGILDFDRWDIGDPWEEFNRIQWCRNVSPAFAKARIDAYFENNVPKDFFPLLYLYMAVNILSSIPWAIDFGEKQVEVMLENATIFVCDTQGQDDFVPIWYKMSTSFEEA